MKKSFVRRGLALPAVLAAFLVCLAAIPAIASAGVPADTVHIRGVAYAFFGIDDHLPGAIVRIEEFPGLSAPVQADGSYGVEVPDERANVTPWIDPPPGYRATYLQTSPHLGSGPGEGPLPGRLPTRTTWHSQGFSACRSTTRRRSRSA